MYKTFSEMDFSPVCRAELCRVAELDEIRAPRACSHSRAPTRAATFHYKTSPVELVPGMKVGNFYLQSA